jgi:hypothetical protein
MGIAAQMSAQTGQDMLNWMREQATVTNRWADEDRSRYTSVFQPLQDQYIADAKDYASPERMASSAAEAGADVTLAARQAGEQRQRQQMAMGVNPASGRAINANAKAGTDTALATAGARNLARRNVEQTGQGMMANAINMGSGLAVNPGTSMGLSNGAGQAGFGGAMQGYGQQANILGAQFGQQMQAYNAKQSGIGALGGALGTLAGAFIPSSKEIKEDKTPVDALGAVRKMPVEAWTYKAGQGDGKRHVGPYAEDFKKATGVGDGKSIDPISMMGVTLGAVRQLAEKVDALGAPPRRMAA